MKEAPFFSIPQPHVYTVSELTSAIKYLLEDNFSFVWVEGEISNARRPPSGHFYFTLKDHKAQLRAVLFKNQLPWLKFKPEDGIKVICQGRISTYEPRGEYQIIVEYLEPKGYGALQVAFEQLKKKLMEEGLFYKKRPLPPLLRHIAVVTSPVGAAIRDFLRILLKNSPNIAVRIYPVKVQGEGAAEQIAQAIYDLNRMNWADAMVLTRGGGSLEDLWAFNEEIVARAIYASKIPVISAIGHEVDFTISDMVADLRAPTPSAAAEIITKKLEDLENRLKEWKDFLLRALSKQKIDNYSLHLDEVSQSLLKVMGHVINHKKICLSNLRDRFIMTHPKRQIINHREILKKEKRTLTINFKHYLERLNQYTEGLNQRLNTLGPLAVLKRGYALAFTLPERDIVRSATQVRRGDHILVKVAQGEIMSEVEGTKE